jgi:site-specific DNA recombinase
MPANKYESAYLVQGQHEPLISEVLFYKVQDVLAGRKKRSTSSIIKKVSAEELPLRGFLNCTKCTRSMTGSASKGYVKHFHYYHCQSSCKIRYPAAKVNDAFIRKPQEFIHLKGSARYFKQLILEMCKDGSEFQKTEYQKLISQISEYNDKVTKARELLLAESIDANDYKIIKKEAEDKIVRLEATLNEVKSKKTDSTNQVEKLIDTVIDVLKAIDTLYFLSSIENKKKIISSIFPEKWVFDGAQHRTGLTNAAAELMRQINKELGNKKSRAITNIRHVHGSVPSAGVEPARFPTGV